MREAFYDTEKKEKHKRKENTMENSTQNFATKKFISILLMALAFVMLNLNWIKFSDNNLEFVEELQEDFEADMEWLEEFFDGDIEAALEEEGYSESEIDAMMDMVDGTEKMIDVLSEGEYSVWSAVSMMTAISDMKTSLTDENLNDSRGAAESAEMIHTLQIIFGVIIGVFAFVGLLMLLAIFAHVRNKYSMGAGALVFSIILSVVVGFFGLIIRFGIDEPGNGVTFAPIVMPILVIASCIVWCSARKNMPAKEQDTLY